MAALERVLTGPGASAAAGPGAAPAWAALLLERRDRTNAVLARARATGARSEDLRAALLDLGPLVETLAGDPAFARDRSGKVDALARAGDALVDTVVGLVRTRRWAGPSAERTSVLETAPLLPAWLAHDPRGTLEVLVHGAHHAAREGHPDVWARRLVAAASDPTAWPSAPGDPMATLRDLGVIAAWRAGVVRTRTAALAAARRVPARAALIALDLAADADLPAALERIEAEPWWWPTAAAHPGQARVMARLGGFRGTGGPWVRQPRVVGSRGDGWRWDVETDAPVAGGAAEHWLVAADAHGFAIRRTTRPDDAPAGARPGLDCADGAFVLAGSPGRLPWDDDLTGSATCGAVALLSRASSYAVDVVVADR
ncbi:hypothetical protein [Pengzhenrongella sicca]|uniref:Uncharacterized protein n=1 Tax=Pengzhenrongella sicca TaxID=2819238 RepID=A0A8A4ZFV9_9MICO|nr:hypothetical protein [Pengzhenrongella sicca]QTE30900.1 hypothetical protein J4E96_08230 [Pengzhenrongella sicca]